MAGMSNLELIETDEFLNLILHDWHVNRCIIDYTFTLRLMSNHVEGIGICIRGGFSVDTGNGSLDFDAEEDPEGLGPALSLIHASVNEIHARKDGGLVIVFSKATLAVSSSDQYEP